MTGCIVVAAYRPRTGKERELAELIDGHVGRLRSIGLATQRMPIIARTADGVIIEVFEWISEEAIARAHTHPDVRTIWQEFEVFTTNKQRFL